MTQPDDATFATPQHMAAEAVAEALQVEGSFRKVSLFKGERFSMITAFIETPTEYRRVRIEVYPES